MEGEDYLAPKGEAHSLMDLIDVVTTDQFMNEKKTVETIITL